MKIGKRNLLSALAAVTLGIQSLGHAEVGGRLSQKSVALGQPLQITFESTGTSASPPDLSILEQDFQIINHSVQQQASVRNGYRTQRSTLTLTLLPRHSGSLEIPSIAFGNERSAVQSVTVLPPSGQDKRAATPMPSRSGAQGPWDPFSMQTPPANIPLTDPNYPASDPSYPGFDRGYPTIAAPFGRTESTYDTPSLSDTEPRRPMTRSTEPLASPSAEKPVSPQTSLQQGCGYPGWLVVLLAAGWLGTLGLFWTRRRPKGAVPEVQAAAPGPAPPPAKPKAETAEESAIRAVRIAYEQGDAEAARAALLQWARTVWQNEAPNNLPRLAERMEEPLRERILKLDKAFYSPTPLDWRNDPVWEILPRRG